jgi:uncharacterized protein with PQ loop repeat
MLMLGYLAWIFAHVFISIPIYFYYNNFVLVMLNGSPRENPFVYLLFPILTVGMYTLIGLCQWLILRLSFGLRSRWWIFTTYPAMILSLAVCCSYPIMGLVVGLTQYFIIKDIWPKRSSVWIIASSIGWLAGPPFLFLAVDMKSIRDESSKGFIILFFSFLSYSLFTILAFEFLILSNKMPKKIPIIEKENIDFRESGCTDVICQEKSTTKIQTSNYNLTDIIFGICVWVLILL